MKYLPFHQVRQPLSWQRPHAWPSLALPPGPGPSLRSAHSGQRSTLGRGFRDPRDLGEQIKWSLFLVKANARLKSFKVPPFTLLGGWTCHAPV